MSFSSGGFVLPDGIEILADLRYTNLVEVDMVPQDSSPIL